ncbi:cAMP-binding domain of CRP or a regulatory subunit of cAMP-dependent protein kinases [Ekhidna lutea]|uniref:cAMP-binding domain of CRP or a regulatory subunit of cAMP-dependent protein kinases n=1 Tax=Ekhidna lutea TaxID=447679 RepID=A0A239INZ8_EKHLU|nr:Crp/Fnr family transcriptional regulator [Ekhidna lutea]SNS95390.1 cAMP-binding domain of CRP or a regulatory subunit of cAMP-dependent protein kinases [Ekhidna lutea]
MQSHIFESYFGKYIDISPEALEFLNASFQEMNYSGREMIVESGGYAKYFYFVLSGVQALYIINEKGEKVILGFSFKGSPSGAFDSFITSKPSHFFLEALSPSKLIGINKQKFDELFERFPEFYKWRALFMEDILLGRISREVEITTMTAKKRFDAFVKRCPPELLEIPQKYLASYLNMKPETFSRLRALRD